MQNAASASSSVDRSIFSKTRMCKFHLLGCCTDGPACLYAHEREELQPRPDLFRTKLCRSLIQTGECTDSTCTFAHNKEELRSSGMLRKSLTAEKAQARLGKQGPSSSSSTKPNYLHGKVSPETSIGHGASVGKAAPMMRPVLIMPAQQGMQFVGNVQHTSSEPVDANASSSSSSANVVDASVPAAASPKPDLKPMEVDLGKKQKEMRRLESTNAGQGNKELGDAVMREQVTELQSNLAAHQARIQQHCDEVHELVMLKSGDDPKYAELQQLQIPPIKASPLNGSSAAMVEHIKAIFDRITILEAYIRAHGGLILSVSMASRMKESGDGDIGRLPQAYQ